MIANATLQVELQYLSVGDTFHIGSLMQGVNIKIRFISAHACISKQDLPIHALVTAVIEGIASSSVRILASLTLLQLSC